MNSVSVKNCWCRGVLRHQVLTCLLLGLQFITCGCGGNKDPIQQVRTLVDQRELGRAVEIAKSIPESSPAWGEAQYLLGRIEAARRGNDIALSYFHAVPRDGSVYSLKAARGAAEIELPNCQLTDAIVDTTYLVEQDTADLSLRARLVQMLISSGQRSQAEIHLFELLKKGKTKLKDLVWFTAPERPSDPDSYLTKCAQANSPDPLIQLGMGLEDLRQQRTEAAKQRLLNVCRQAPELAMGQGQLGELLLDGSLEELGVWYRAVPPALQDDPGIWYVRGLWARRVNQPQVAARCFWETIRQLPTHQRAMYQLGQLAIHLDPPAGEAFSRRAQQLKEYGEVMESTLIQRGRDREKFQQMVAKLLEMGRDWEAWAWASSAVELSGRNGWPGELLDSLASVPAENPPRTRLDHDVAVLHDLSSWPGFETIRSVTPPGPPSPPEPPASPDHSGFTNIQFEDQAKSLGIDFTYFQSHHPDSRGVRMFESTGGGVGVLDYDLDGWPDLFLTQGVEWPMGSERPESTGKYRDRLLRNRGSGFADITELSTPHGETGYGQGCSAGDFDNDGFADLYVANIGLNQLLRNNGDGTFTDISRTALIEGEAWTTSCLIADLNGDGNPDLFDVNYLQGENIFRIECSANRCSVRTYEGAPDQVQLSRGDGTFETITKGTPQANAKGLGIVLVNVGDEPLPRIFVANDQVPNFFLKPVSSDGRYLDEGMSSGLAVNLYGQPTACMGVAAGDLNHDGKLDLFVTNFEGEANNLYLQRDHGLFEDAIIGSGLMSAGVPYVGWGTQFLDADNDGELDLVVANGHIADFHEPGIEYRMPLQFFQNAGSVRFQQLDTQAAGSCFGKPLFGRAMALIDWNRDGQTDFVLGCLDSPAMVVTSVHRRTGHWLDVILHARDSARDALGAVVEVHAGSMRSTMRLVAGDGFQASNQRMLHFGLGAAGTIDLVLVRWPSGSTTEYRGVSRDSTIHLVEGQISAMEVKVDR